MEKYEKKRPGGGPGGYRGIQEGSGRGLETPCGSQGVPDRVFSRFLTSAETPGGPPGKFLGKYFHVFSFFWGLPCDMPAEIAFSSIFEASRHPKGKVCA